jgi:DNA-binding transcriptional MocR family regulator
MPTGTQWTRPAGGLFVWATLPDDLDSKAMVPRAIAARVAYVPGTGFYADGSGQKHMRLNFSYPDPERIREGIRRLAGVIEQETATRAVFHGAL